jgi:hypothetical protein
MKDNVFHFSDGGTCAYYNKPITSVIILECGTSETLAFKRKINACHYEFIFTTKVGCNIHKLNKLRNIIKSLI